MAEGLGPDCKIQTYHGRLIGVHAGGVQGLKAIESR